MKLSEWRELLLKVQHHTDPKVVGKPYILKRSLPNLHIAVVEGEALVATRLVRTGQLAFQRRGWTYGSTNENEHVFVVPPSTMWHVIPLRDLEPYRGEIDWDAEVPGMELIA